jgi:hypothetical protein
MAAARKGNGNTSKTNPAVVKGALRNVKAGVPPKPAKETQEDEKRFLSNVSQAACVREMEKALGFGKQALHLEIAIALATFAQSEAGPSLEAKRAVMSVYADAGFDVNPNGDDYKTVNRRINAAAALFNHMGMEAVTEAMSGKKDEKAIEALKTFLTTEFSFKGINSVLAAAGKPVAQTNTPERREQAKKQEAVKQGGTPEQHAQAGAQSHKNDLTPEDKGVATEVGAEMQARREEVAHNRRATDVQGDVVVLTTAHLHLAVPRDIDMAEISEMITKLATFQAIRASVGSTQQSNHTH